MLSLLVLILPAVQTTPAPVPSCSAEVVPAELAGWTDRRPLKAAASAVALPAAALVPGKAMAVVLAPATTVAFGLSPQQPAKPDSFGGMVSVTVPQAGRYRVALGTGAWIDVVKDGAAMPSGSHTHGPVCSTVRKMVDFDLRPGTYTLQMSGSVAPAINVMVVRLR